MDQQERWRVFAAIGDMLSRGYEHHEVTLEGSTVMGTMERDPDASIDDYEVDVYPNAVRREQWRNDVWHYVVLTVRVFSEPGLNIWDVQGADGDRLEIGRESLASVESDSGADYLTELVESLYVEAMAKVVR